jgi:TRAP transporter TAXI family solute receptor
MLGNLLRIALGIALASALGACAREPDAEEVRTEVQRRLDEEFQAGLFELTSLRRAGTAPFRVPEAGAGVLVYFNAELEFLKDSDLASWDALNLGTLLYLLGATEAGVDGYRGRENVKADVLRVFGRVLYAQRDGVWTPLHAAPPEPLEASEVRTLEGEGAQAVLSRVRALLEHPPVGEGAEERIIREELGTADRSIAARIARSEGAILLATGQPLMTFNEVGARFAAFATEHGLRMHATPTRGSLANALLVGNGDAEFGFVQNDVAEALYRGAEAELDRALGLRAVLSLWPVALQLITLEGSDVRALRDLAGRPIAIGALGSGAHFTTRRLAVLSGIPMERWPVAEQLSLERGIESLEKGNVDALLLTEPVPMRAVQALATRRAIRLVPIEPSVIEAFTEKHASYRRYVIPARTYPGQTEPVTTLGLTAMLVTTAATPGALVTQLLDQVFASIDDVEEAEFRASFISRQTARVGISIPLHPAAEAYLKRN